MLNFVFIFLILYKMVQNGHKMHLLWYKRLKQRRKVLILCVCVCCLFVLFYMGYNKYPEKDE